MKSLSAVILLILIAASIAVMWVPAKWGTSVPEVGAFGLMALWAVLFMLRRESAQVSSVMIPLAGVMVWAGFQLAAGITVYPYQTWLSILYWAGNFAIFFVAVQIFSDYAVQNLFLRALLILGFIASIVSALEVLTTRLIFWVFPIDYGGFVMGPFVYHNQFAAFIELLLPVALYFALTGDKWRVFDLLIAATMYASVIVSASRAGFVFSTAELILVPVIVLARRGAASRQIVGAAVLLLGMVFLLGISAGPDVIAARFGLKDPFALRREFNISSLAMFKDRPLLGFGLGNWATVYPKYALFDDGLFANQAHNDWAEWAVEGGIPLVLLQLWTALWAAPRAWRSGWGLGVPIVFLHRFFDFPLQRPAVALVFFAIMGALAAPRKSSVQSRQRPQADSRSLRLVPN